MAIKDDIKEALDDIGTEYLVLRDSGNVSGEKLDWNPNRQVTKPFIKEFFIEALLPYDSSALPGDYIQIVPTNEIYLTTSRTPQVFENEIIQYDGVIYKCNVSGELLRPLYSGYDSNYKRTQTLSLIKENCYALLTASLFGGGLEDDELGQLNISNNEMYIAKSIGIQIGDRYSPVSGEYYRVSDIKTRRFPGVDVVILEEDNR